MSVAFRLLRHRLTRGQLRDGPVTLRAVRAIVIGAGRGSRLGHNTDLIPKTLVEVMGRPILDWILDALLSAGFTRKDVVFVCGYAEDVVRARYPEFTFVRNEDWANNNILLSLLCAREHFGTGFVSTYADIVYDGEIVQKLVSLPRRISRSVVTRPGDAATSGAPSTPRQTRRSCVPMARRSSSSAERSQASPPTASSSA